MNLVSACDLRRTQVSTRACDSDTLSQHAYQCVIDGWVWFLGCNGRESGSGLDRDRIECLFFQLGLTRNIEGSGTLVVGSVSSILALQ